MEGEHCYNRIIINKVYMKVITVCQKSIFHIKNQVNSHENVKSSLVSLPSPSPIFTYCYTLTSESLQLTKCTVKLQKHLDNNHFGQKESLGHLRENPHDTFSDILSPHHGVFFFCLPFMIHFPGGEWTYF